MKYAKDNDLSKYTDDDIADAIYWEGDPKAVVEALINSEFIDVDVETGKRIIHDCREFTRRRTRKEKVND